MKIIAPLLKLGLGGGAVYFIVKEGVFSDSQEETIKASKKIVDSVPGVSPYLEQIPKLMSKEEMIKYWNSATVWLAQDDPVHSLCFIFFFSAIGAFGISSSYTSKKPSITLVPLLVWDLESVKISVSALASLPENSKEALHKGYSYMKDELKKQMQTPNQAK